MAERLIHYPKGNPIQFVPENDPAFLTNTKYKFPHYDKWWNCQRRAPFQPLANYFQKVEQGDTIVLEFHSNNAGETGATVRVYNLDWTLITGLSTASTAVAGYTITSQATGTTYTAYTHIAQQYVGALGLPDGKYFLVIEVPFAGGDPAVMISEPIWLREHHPDTLLLEYRKSYNDADIFWQLHNLTMGLRVESYLWGLTPISDDTFYEDELLDNTLTYSVAGETYQYGVRRVPSYMINKVNRVFSCDLVRIDSPNNEDYFIKAKDAKFEATNDANTNVFGGVLTVQKAKNTYSQEASYQTPILIWEILNNGDSGGGDRFPFFVRQSVLRRTGAPNIRLMLNLNGIPGPFPYTTDCKEVRNTADEQVLVDHANNVTKPANNQLGYYSLIVSGGNAGLYYNPHPSETNYVGNSSIVLSQHFNVNFQNGAYGSAIFYDIRGSWIGYAVDNSIGIQRNAGYGNGNPANTYLVGGSTVNIQNNIARVYHKIQTGNVNTITRFLANYPTQTPNITAITGTVPRLLTHFRIYTASIYYTGFTWSILVPCATTIGDVTLSGNAIVASTGPSAFGAGNLPQLYNVDFFKNKLTTPAVDDIFNELYNGGAKIYVLMNGGINTAGQSPVAPPSAGSLTAIIAITGDGWAILTD